MIMAFDLGAMLKDVSNLGTDREQIEYIRLELIDSDEKNFYELSDLDGLANNIATIGLQQPLRLRKHPTEAERYIIISGHRRRAALELLAKEEPERWTEVACIVEQTAASPALQQLCLIFGNSNTRKLSSSDLSEQAVQVERLLYQLKEEGYEFPGRMRDHVAQVVQTSKTKLARLKMIRENLAECWQPAYKNDTLGESAAYELCRLPAERQRVLFEEKQRTGANIRWLYADDVKKFAERCDAIVSCTCKKNGDGVCTNQEAKFRKAAVSERYALFYCDKCCNDCCHLTSCKSVCPKLREKAKQMRSDAKEAQRQQKLAEEERDRPKIEKIQELWYRFGIARRVSGASAKAVYKAAKMYYAKTDDKKMEVMEGLCAKFDPNTTLPYGYSFHLSDANALIAVADLLDCSLDYLFCRTDVREVAQEDSPGEVSESDTGERPGAVPGVWYPASVEPPLGAHVVAIDKHDFVDDAVYEGCRCLDSVYIPSLDEVKLWMIFPCEERDQESGCGTGSPPAINNSCKTGMSPSGHCGSAAVCGEPVDCCLSCDKDCNLRCGWMEDIEHGLSVSDN